jgi:sugar transferase EpsL
MKRLFDLILSLMAIFLLSPVLIALAVLIKMKLGSPVFFRQQRPGLHGQPFTILKFRTMLQQKDRHGHILPSDWTTDNERLTSFGNFLRKSSLDELPELFNVLRGDMSLVGPRPLLMEYLEQYSPEQARRHEVKPGITGWAQVNGRNALDWEEKFRLDVWYVDHHTFWLDLKIIFRTILQTIKREGVNAPGYVSGPPGFVRKDPNKVNKDRT